MSRRDPEPEIDEIVGQLSPQIRSVVDAAPPLSLAEISGRTTPARGRRKPSAGAWRLVAAAVAALVLVTTGLAWRYRSTGSAPSELLAIPAQVTGPIPAENTAASTGDPSRTSPARWDVVRTGADDRQLVVYFDGGGCGNYRADVVERPDTISITVLPVYEPNQNCLAMLLPQAIGIQLSEPLGDRTLQGFRVMDGIRRDRAVVVSGSQLFTMTWPPGSARAASEHMNGQPSTGDFVWTQQFHDAGQTDNRFDWAVTLEQWRGAPAIDAKAFATVCMTAGLSTVPLAGGFTTTAVDVNGAAGTLVHCPDQSLAVVWAVDTDRLALHSKPNATSLDEISLVDLAKSVHRGK
jgi:hypothetical protein